MQILNVEQGTPEWHELRKGKITGTRLGDVWAARAYTKADILQMMTELGEPFVKSSTIAQLEAGMSDEVRQALLSVAPRKIGFYEIIAERLSIDRDDENRMDRGLRLEGEAREMFEREYNKKVTQVGICVSDTDPRVINSPDGLIKDVATNKFTEAVEIKCLAPARHIQAIVENTVPDEYWTQKLQYFVVNPDLQKLYFVFYDPGIASRPFHVVEVTREELGDWPERLLQFQTVQLNKIDEIVEQLAF